MEQCKKCTGLEKCNKYCHLQMGASIVSFINGIDTVETRIGDLEKGSPNVGDSDLIISGHMVDTSSTATYILSSIKTSICASGKFTQYDGMYPGEILKRYLDSLSVDPDVKHNSILTFKKYNSNRMLPIPIKPGTECEITYDDDGKSRTIKSKVNVVKWRTDPQTSKLICEILFVVEKGMYETNYKSVKIPITEYGTKLKILNIERSLKSSEIDREIIKMEHCGFIKPIIVKDNKVTLALDGQRLYRILDDGKAVIAANFNEDKLVDFQGGLDPLKKTKAYRKIRDNLDYIEKHKRFIAPYGLMEAVVLEV